MRLVVRLLFSLLLLIPSGAAAHSILPLTPRLVVKVNIGSKWGSGVFISSTELLTAEHLVVIAEFRAKPMVVLDKPASVVCRSPEEFDIARLKAANPTYAHDHPVPLDLRDFVVGEEVVFAGYPPGSTPLRVVRTTITGIVHQLSIHDFSGAEILYDTVALAPNPGAIDMGGMSGGAVVDKDGELIGLICCYSGDMTVAGFVPLKGGLNNCKAEGS